MINPKAPPLAALVRRVAARPTLATAPLLALILATSPLYGEVAWAQASVAQNAVNPGTPEPPPPPPQQQQEDFRAALSVTSWNPTPEELEEALKKWVQEYVTYIITDEEERIFESLPTPEMKLAFTERFWDVRDPTPGTTLNEYRQEHLVRWATANRRFSAGKAGWNTDRGRVYIIMGPPNQLQRNPTGRGPGERASEVWTYNLADNPALRGVLDLDFVDFHGTGEYELVSNLDAASQINSAQFGYVNSPLDVYALRRHADTIYDEQYLNYRFADPTQVASDFLDFQDNLREILRIPEIHRDRLAELRAGEAVTDVVFDAFPLSPAIDFYEAVAGSTAVQVTLALEHDELSGAPVGPNRHFSADTYVALETQGVVVAEDEKRLNFSLTDPEIAQLAGTQLLQSFQLMVRPGEYDLVILVRDNTSDRLGRTARKLTVPSLTGEGLRLSTLTLASRIETMTPDPAAPPRDFQIGNMRVVPNVKRTYFPDQPLLLYLQAYGLVLDEAGTNRVTLRGEVRRGDEVFRRIPEQHPFPAPMSRQSFSLGLPLTGYGPGVYEVLVVVADDVAGTSVTVREDFAVLPPTAATPGR